MEIERIVNNRNSKFPWLWLILGIILIGTIVGVIVAVSNNQNPNSPIHLNLETLKQNNTHW